MAEVCYRFDRNLLVSGSTVNVVMGRLNEMGYGVKMYSETRRGNPVGLKVSTRRRGDEAVTGIDDAVIIATKGINLNIGRTKFKR